MPNNDVISLHAKNYHSRQQQII